MRHSWRGVLAALLALSLAVPACAAPAEGEAAARREDLEFLYQTLERAHPDLFANTPEGQFLERKAAIEAGLEEVDDFTFALELQSLTALAGDSHTTLALGGSLSQTVHYYPMSLLYRDGRWYLSAAPSDRRALLGREVTAVNGRSMEKTVDVFGAILSADNGVKLRRQYRQSCNVAEFYEYLGLVQEGGPLELTLAGGGELVLSPVPAEELGQTGLVRLSDGLPQPVTGTQERFYLAFPLDKGTYYIQYNRCREDPELPMETFAAQVEQDLSAGEYRRVIVDLRNNGGGSDGVIWPLLQVLRRAMDRGLEGVGLIGEATFSSAIINAVELQEMGMALVGGACQRERGPLWSGALRAAAQLRPAAGGVLQVHRPGGAAGRGRRTGRGAPGARCDRGSDHGGHAGGAGHRGGVAAGPSPAAGVAGLSRSAPDPGTADRPAVAGGRLSGGGGRGVL